MIRLKTAAETWVLHRACSCVVGLWWVGLASIPTRVAFRSPTGKQGGPWKVLLSAQFPLERFEAAHDRLADDVRSHQIDAAGAFREGFTDALEASP
jgi:hypothetical protein